MSIIRKLLWGIVVFILLMIAVMITIPIFFEDEIKQAALKEMNKTLKAKVNFKDVNLTFFRNFPHFTFVMKEFSVTGKKPFQGDTLTYIQDFGLALNLSSVYTYLTKGGKLNIRSIELHNAKIHAQVLENGTASWDIVKASDTTQKSQEQPPSDTAGGGFNIGLQSFEISETDIIYNDQSSGLYTALKGLDHELSGDFTQDQFTMNTYTYADKATMAYGGINYLNGVELEADADLGMNMKKMKFTFKDNNFRLNALRLGLDGSLSMPNEAINTNLRFEAKETKFKHILSLVPAIYAKSFEDIKTEGKLALDGFAKGQYKGEQYPAFGLNLKVKNAMFKYPDLPKGVNNIQINTQINNRDGKPDHTVVDVSKFHVELGKEPFDMTLLLEHPISDPSIDATMKGKINLGRISKLVPLEKGTTLKGIINADVKTKGRYSTIEKGNYHQFTAKGNINISNLVYNTSAYPGMKVRTMKLDFEPAYLALTTFNGKFGESDVSASGRFNNYLAYYLKDEPLNGNFTMNSKHFNTNEWMTEEEGEAQKQKTEEKTSADTTQMTAFEVPKNINFTLSSQFGELIYDDLTIKNVKGKVMIRDQRVSLRNLQMNLLEGSMTMSGYYDSKNIKQPKYDFYMDITQMDIQKSFKKFNTMKKLAPIAEHAYGDYSVKTRIMGDMDYHMNPVYETMNGRGEMILKDVTIKNYKPLSKMAEKLKMDDYKQMRIKEARPSFKIRDGKVHVDPFNVEYQQTKMTISGYNTLEQKVNYFVKMKVPREKLGGQANQMISSLMSQAQNTGLDVKAGETINLDVNIKGPYKQPTVKISYAGTEGEQKSAEEQAKEAVKEQVDEAKEEAKDKAKEEAKKAKEKAEKKAKEEAEKQKKKAEEEAEKQKDKAKEKAEEEAEKQKDKAKEETEEKVKDLNPF